MTCFSSLLKLLRTPRGWGGHREPQDRSTYLWNVKVYTCVVSSVRIICPVKATDSGRLFGADPLDLIDFLLPSDLLNGAQEKCELPPMDGFPHCEGKVKVNNTHTHSHTQRQPLSLSVSVSHTFFKNVRRMLEKVNKRGTWPRRMTTQKGNNGIICSVPTHRVWLTNYLLGKVFNIKPEKPGFWTHLFMLSHLTAEMPELRLCYG